MKICDFISERKSGNVRYSVASIHPDEISVALTTFGLSPDNELIEHNESTAKELLENLFWKDLAYGTECMPKTQAKLLAQRFFELHSKHESRYFSNSRWIEPVSFTSLTNSTFDSGIIIKCEANLYSCIWFEDED